MVDEEESCVHSTDSTVSCTVRRLGQITSHTYRVALQTLDYDSGGELVLEEVPSSEEANGRTRSGTAGR